MLKMMCDGLSGVCVAVYDYVGGCFYDICNVVSSIVAIW